MFTNAWPMIQTMTALTTIFANGSVLARMMRTNDDREHDEQQQHDDGAEQPELLADDGEDEVVVGFGQPGPLGLRVAEADAEDAAGGERPPAVHRLPAGPWSSCRSSAAAQPGHDAVLSRARPNANIKPPTAITTTGIASIRSRTPAKNSAPKHDRRP